MHNPLTETLDRILHTDLAIIQKKKGYRFTCDSTYLAHFVEVPKDANILELGSGSGIISLLLATKHTGVHITGIELQETYHDLALRNIQMNNLEKIVECIQGNFRTLKLRREFDIVVANPPYRKWKSGRINPLEEKALARHEITATLDDVVEAAKRFLKNKGAFYIIYNVERMVDLISTLRAYALEPKKIKLILHKHEAIFVLVKAIYNGNPGCKIYLE